MLARCARCQGTFTTDRFGRQFCPHCGSELDLADPNAPRPPPQHPPPSDETPPLPSGERAGVRGPAGAGELPPPPPPPPGGYGPPPGGAWGPPPPPPGYGPPPGGGWGAPPGGYGPPPGGGWGGPPGGPGPVGPELPAPFAERATRGFLTSFFETWKLVATEPQRFFRHVRIDQPGSAVLFGVLAATFGSVVNGLYSWVSSRQGLAAAQAAMRDLPPEAAQMVRKMLDLFAGPGVLWSAVLSPLTAVVGIYLTAAIVHVLLMLFRGALRGFDATLTTVGYAYGLYILMAVPACGGLVAMVWYLVVLVIGLGQAQRCGTGKSAAAVFTPAVLLCLCCCAAAGLGFGAFLKNVAQPGTQQVSL